MQIVAEAGADRDSWSNSDVVTDAGTAGFVHGPWGNDVQDMEKTFSVPAGITQCTVSWRSWSIDSRNNEWDRVFVDGAEVWAAQARASRRGNWLTCCDDFPQRQGSSPDVHFQDVSVEVACSGSLVVRFNSEINQGINDEAWAFSNVRIAESPNQRSCLAGGAGTTSPHPPKSLPLPKWTTFEAQRT